VKLAYVSPLPPAASGVADYGAVLLPYLRPHLKQCVAVVDGYLPELAPHLVDGVYDVSDGIDWWKAGQFVPLYHMGNHIQHHRYIYEALQHFPGITVLHDGNLLPFVHDLTLAQGNPAGFVREAGFEQGGEGGVAAFHSLRYGEPLDVAAYPMLSRVARASLGVIVHNEFLRQRVLKAWSGAQVAVIPHLDLMPPDPDPMPRGVLKAASGMDPDTLLVGAFGFIAPSKRLEPFLRAFARLQRDFPQARFICVGQVTPGYDLDAIIDGLNLKTVVHMTGYVSMETFLRYLRAVDVGINLRYPTWGESSGPLLRLMACSVPTLVTRAGAFAELPDDAAIQVPIGPDEVDTIEAALRHLLNDAEARTQMGKAARAYADECHPTRIASQYVAFIHSVL
jgi:glycosyltransferase involved in cell wall biosynthesis